VPREYGVGGALSVSYPKTEIFSATQLMLTSSDPSQFSKVGSLLTANLFSGASRLRNYRPKQGPAPFLNTLLPGIAALTYHAKRKRPPNPPHVCPFSLVLLASFTHSTKLPIFHPATVLRHTRELTKKLIFKIWDEKSHTVVVEEVDHHQ
jgi:hypothetical protein